MTHDRYVTCGGGIMRNHRWVLSFSGWSNHIFMGTGWRGELTNSPRSVSNQRLGWRNAETWITGQIQSGGWLSYLMVMINPRSTRVRGWKFCRLLAKCFDIFMPNDEVSWPSTLVNSDIRSIGSWMTVTHENLCSIIYSHWLIETLFLLHYHFVLI